MVYTMQVLPIKFSDSDYATLKQAAGVLGLPMSVLIKDYTLPPLRAKLKVHAKEKSKLVSHAENHKYLGIPLQPNSSIDEILYGQA